MFPGFCAFAKAFIVATRALSTSCHNCIFYLHIPLITQRRQNEKSVFETFSNILNRVFYLKKGTQQNFKLG